MNALRRRDGFTILELLISLVLGMIIIAGSYAIFVGQQRGFESVAEFSQLAQSARLTLDQVSRELRMAGFGVITGESFVVAKKYEFTFLGDIDADIAGITAADIAAGATAVPIDLEDARDTVEAGDYLFINGGGHVEMIQVDATTPANMSGEPDLINLSSGLQNDYLAGQTLVRTIEQVDYAVTFPGGNLKRNNVLLAEDLYDLEFHYLREDGAELEPDPVSGLTQIQRSAVRKVEIRLETSGTHGGGRIYTQIVELRNMGNRPFSPDSCPPNPPTNVQVTASDTCEQFTVTWSPPTANACDDTALADLGGYKIQYGTGSGNYLVPAANVADEVLTTYTVDDPRLENNTVYYMTMVAYDTSFNESAEVSEQSFRLEDTSPPAPPTEVQAAAGVGTVNLTWTKSVDVDVKGYRIYRSDSGPVALSADNRIADETTLDVEAEFFTDTDVSPCVTYHYAITVIDCANEGEPSAEVYGDGDGPAADVPDINTTSTTPIESPATPPAAPEPFQAVGRDQAVDLVWTNPTDADFAGVTIRYSQVSYPTSPTDGTLVDTFGGTAGQAMSQAQTGLQNGTTYYFTAFAFDRCGNYSEAVQAQATPNAAGPVVQIVSPTQGMVVENGRLVFQTRAYDPDQTGLTEPPSFAADNGKGIAGIYMYVTPDPGVYELPHMEYLTEYCGFGGDTDPCPAGDITDWCDGTYQFYAIAVDDEGAQGVSPYISVTIRNGGIYLDDTYVPTVTGTYDNQVVFQIKNDSGADVTIHDFTFTWDKTLARLSKIEMPTGDTAWQSTTAPAASGQAVELSFGDRPTISSGSTRTVRVTFMQVFARLTSSAATGSTRLYVENSAGFAVGETVYLVEGANAEQVTIAATGGSTIDLTTGLTQSFSLGSVLRHTATAEDVALHGADLRVAFDYQKSTWSGRTCPSDEITVPLAPAPVLHTARQDQPTLDTTCSTATGLIAIDNYRTVPINVQVTDHGGSGIASVTTYYYTDSAHQAVAPESGYAELPLSYNSSTTRWEGTIPYQSDVRVWFYFTTVDDNGVTDREPSAGAFTYDYQADNTPPPCPLGLVATMISSGEIALSWTESNEPDIAGYNIYRSDDCGSFKKKYTLVEDQDANTPGVQFPDTGVLANKKCYRYYVVAVDLQGNGSTGCETYASNSVGDCPCP
jgi:type II secretory pathway pseudopilin PulG